MIPRVARFTARYAIWDTLSAGWTGWPDRPGCQWWRAQSRCPILAPNGLGTKSHGPRTQPQDRIEAVRPPVEALGAKILAGGYPFGEYDVLLVLEAPDDATAASVAMAVAAGGAVKSAKTTRLLSGQEWTESLRKAQGSQYRPAR